MDVSTSPATAEGLATQGAAVFGHRNKGQRVHWECQGPRDFSALLEHQAFRTDGPAWPQNAALS